MLNRNINHAASLGAIKAARHGEKAFAIKIHGAKSMYRSFKARAAKIAVFHLRLHI